MIVAPMPITTQSSIVAACTVAPGPIVTRLPITVGSACGMGKQGSVSHSSASCWRHSHCSLPARMHCKPGVALQTRCAQRLEAGSSIRLSHWCFSLTLPAALCLATWINTLSCTLVLSPIVTLLTSPAARQRLRRRRGSTGSADAMLPAARAASHAPPRPAHSAVHYWRHQSSVKDARKAAASIPISSSHPG